MRKFLYSVFMLAAVVLVFTACSNDETIETSGNGQNNKGMVLVATVSQQDSRATIDVDVNDTKGTWKFTFDDNDNVVVGNNTIDNYYTFTKNGDNFSCADAKPTASPTTWYAYYPGTDINLTNQEGTDASAAKLYALAGATTTATTGETGLTINMTPQVAVLRIVKVDNYGPCDIYLKTANGKYVSGLKAKTNEAGFDVVTSNTKVSVFKKESNGNAGIYYVIVPAGVKISVYNANDENHIKTTKAGLTVGKYYTLTTGPTTGTETATLANGTTLTVDWVQLWIGGPRFAVKNVAEPMTWHDAVKTGSNFAWGEKWYIPSKADIKPLVDLAADQNAWEGKSEITKTGYPTFELKTDAQEGYNYVQITGYQPGYNKNTLNLYNKITPGFNTYNFWTSDESNDKGCEFQIIENSGAIVGFGIGYVTYKDVAVLTRPILTAKTILWSNQYITNNK
uniref:fimbrillin family protein n=1 Tax=Prevotella sp. TaxID=59823 RepID=UPI00402627FD